MIDSNTAIQYMFAELQQLSIGYHPQLKKEFNIRCPFCGDSQKSKHEHLYIKMIPDERDGVAYFPYSCKLCPEKAKIMTVKAAKKLGITNTQLLEYLASLQSINDKRVRVSGSNFIGDTFDFKATDIQFSDPMMIAKKKRYMYERLGSEDIVNHPEKYKIIYDLREFMTVNKIKPNREYYNGNTYKIKNMLNEFNMYSVGFVSFDNTHVNFRDTRQNAELRYRQYMLNRYVSEETSGIYIIPTKINIMGSYLKIVMAEGPFDILRIYTDFYKDMSKTNVLFASVANSHGYIPCVNKFLEFGVMFDEIEIYSDNDVSLKDYRTGIRPLVPDAKIRIFYNQAAKDVGNINDPLDLKAFTL